MIFISLTIEKITVPCSYCAPFVPPNLLHTHTKYNLYLANSLAVALSKPALYRFLTFHVPSKMSIFLFLFHDGPSRNTPPLPGDPSGGVFNLRIVLSPEESSRP